MHLLFLTQDLDRIAEVHSLACLGAEPEPDQAPQQHSPPAAAHAQGIATTPATTPACCCL
jgi:hypothetical protein